VRYVCVRTKEFFPSRKGGENRDIKKKTYAAETSSRKRLFRISAFLHFTTKKRGFKDKKSRQMQNLAA